MTEPSKERITAALALAEVAERHGTISEQFLSALAAYRATAPKLRTRAEVDAEIATVCRMAYGAATINTPFYRERVEKLCAEPTAEESER